MPEVRPVTAYAVILSTDVGTTLAPLATTPECAVRGVSPFEGANVLGLATIALEPEPITGMRFVLREVGPNATPVALPQAITDNRLRQENAQLWDRLRAPRGSHEPPARNPPPLAGEPAAASTGRWCCISREGMATLCANRDDACRTAAECDEAFPHHAPHVAAQLVAVPEALADDAFAHLRDAVAGGCRIQVWRLVEGAASSGDGHWVTLPAPEFACPAHLYRVHPEDVQRIPSAQVAGGGEQEACHG